MKNNLPAPLIHIGYHKTATTWMQNRLFIAANPVFEPLSEHNSGASSLAPYFVWDANGYLLSPFANRDDELQAAIDDMLSKRPALLEKIPVLSNERLSGNPDASGFDAKSIAERIQASFPGAKILIVVREQESFIYSNYFNYIHSGGSHGIKKYLSTGYEGPRPHFSPCHVEYHRLVGSYQELFGKRNVLVLPYELFRSSHTAFLSHLGAFVGCDLEVPDDAFAERINLRNQTAADYHMRFLGRFRRHTSINDFSPWATPLTMRAAGWLLRACRRIVPERLNTGTKEAIRQEIATWAQGRFSRSNVELTRITGTDFSMFGYD